MLLLLIPVIWLALAAFVVCLCRGAAQADAMLIANGEHERERAGLDSRARSRTVRRRATHSGLRAPTSSIRGARVGH
jgi:hypothetical protein